MIQSKTAEYPGRIDLSARLVSLFTLVSTTILVGIPLLMLLVTAFRGPAEFLPFEAGASFTLDNVREIYAAPQRLGSTLLQTLIFVCGTVIFTSIMAFGLAWITERTDLPGRDAWFAGIVAPLLIPTPVVAIAWIIVFGPKAGWANLSIQAVSGANGPFNVFSMAGLVACQCIVSTPFVYLQFCAALRSMSTTLEEAAAMAGAGAWKTFRRITMPVLLPGLLAPVTLLTLVTFEQFELPLIIGLPARVDVFAYRIYAELNPSSGLPNYGGACAISLPFLALGLTGLWLYNRATRHASRYVTVTGKSFAVRRIPLGIWRRPCQAVLLAFVVVAGVLPVSTLIWTSLFGYVAPGSVTLSKADWTIFVRLLGNQDFWRALANTMVVAIMVALITTVLGGLIAWVVARSRVRWASLLDSLSFTSLGIPAVVAGLAVMVLYLSVPLGVYGTLWILVIAYSYRLATTARIAKAGLIQIHPELEEAALVSGGSVITVLRRVLLPLLMPSLVSSFLIAAIVSLREFTLPFILASSENTVIPVLIWQAFQNGQPNLSAALSTLTILLVTPAIFFVGRLR